ncbi:MAG: thioredoxin-disulfide reductase [Alphaproteobacteria bacterium]
MAHHHSKVLVIGSGPAGYTAALYTARASLNPIIVAGLQPGGQMTITSDVENYPGFAEVIQGPWLMEQMQKQVQHVGARIIHDTIVSADLTARRCVGDSGDTYSGDVIIIATGARARWLGLPSEEKFRGLGVSACATCDGFFFRGKTVVVVGGGNTAVEEAIYLTNHATKVHLIHRRDSLRAEKIMQERLFANPKINMIWNATVEEIEGGGTPPVVTGLALRDTRTGATSRLAVDGVFVAIGHSPETELFKGQITTDSEGYIKRQPDSTATNLPGVFAAGDVADKVFRQAVTAAGLGCMAAIEAERYLAGHAASTPQAAQ